MNNIERQLLHQAIADTMVSWQKRKTVVEFFDATCPLCKYMMKATGKPLFKGSSRGVCPICPMKYIGSLSLCATIHRIRETHAKMDIDLITVKEIRTQVVTKMKLLEELIFDNQKYENYLEDIKTLLVIAPVKSRQPELTSHQAPIIRRAKKVIPLTKRKVYKTKHSNGVPS
jgi:succinate dehydrogenase/fumarate reductase-like Fe-S protein